MTRLETVMQPIQQDFDGEDFERLFTPERLTHIDRAIATMDAGRGMTLEQVDAELAKRRAEWLERNRS